MSDTDDTTSPNGCHYCPRDKQIVWCHIWGIFLCVDCRQKRTQIEINGAGDIEELMKYVPPKEAGFPLFS